LLLRLSRAAPEIILWWARQAWAARLVLVLALTLVWPELPPECLLIRLVQRREASAVPPLRRV
jgi:hypothetical protein